MTTASGRRDFLGKGLLGAAGVGACYGLEERILLAAVQETGAKKDRPRPAGELPRGNIGNVSVSRLFLGGNLIGGWAHSRDLLYVSELFRAYNTEDRIQATLALAEQCGINTVLVDPRCWDSVAAYRKRGGKLQAMVCISPEPDAAKTAAQVKSLVDKGAELLYTHGEVTDRLVLAGRTDVLGKAIDLMKAQGVPAGIGSHSLECPVACEKEGLNPDYYVKTFHRDRYWSATPKEKREEWCWYKGSREEHDRFHDNIWCLDPEKTAAFMAAVARPWVAFKVMAAGAIPPRQAFSFAFRNGADFVVAGMFDFQIEEDVAAAVGVLRNMENRRRPWRG